MSFVFPRLFDSKLWQGRQNFVLSVQKIILKKQRSSKKFSKFSLVIGRWSTFSGLLGMIFQQVCQSSISDVLRNSLRRLTSEEVFNVFGIIRFWTKNFRTSSKVFRQSGQNCILHIRRDSWRKNAFFEKKRIFRYFWTFTEFFIDLRQKLFPWGCESFTLRIQRNNLWMKFFLTLIGHWANRIRPSEKQLTQVSQNCFLRVQSNIFGEHCFFEKKFFLSNLGICGKVSGLWQKVLSSVFQTALCVSTTTFSDFLASFRFSGTFDFWIIFYSISSRTFSMLLSIVLWNILMW